MKSRPDESRRELARALRGRFDEIERTILSRVYAIEPPARGADPEYREGLRQAIGAAIDHTIEAAEGSGEERAPPMPLAILSQARLAARRQIPLETMLRRYMAGHAVLGDFVVEEAQCHGLPSEILRWLLRAQAARTDQVLAAISGCYVEELADLRPLSTQRRRLEQARSLLAGELVDPVGLEYDLDGWHMGLVVRAPEGEEGIHAIARDLDLRGLVVPVEDGLLWAWLGAREKALLGSVGKMLRAGLGDASRVGIGEPGESRLGWRLTHEQARASLSVAERIGATTAWYGEVALLASAMRDEVFTASLRTLYLAPLEDGRTDGKSLRDTLRVYLETDQSVTSTAATLGVNRNTVAKRLRQIEDRIGILRGSRAASVIVALQLGD